MLRAIFLALSALVLFVMLAAGIVVGARSLPVRVSYVEQQDCFARAKTEHDQHPECPKTETLWDRGLRDPVAFYTLWLTLFTLALAIGAAFQSGLIWRQISLAREEFIASHRPRLRVRSIMTDGLGGGTFVTIANVGESKATVIGTAGQFSMRNPTGKWLGGRPHLSPERPVPIEYRYFRTGQRHTYGMDMNAPDPAEVIQIMNRHEILVTVGVICYADKNGIERRTGYCWAYDPDTGQFFDPEKTTEYNYED